MAAALTTAAAAAIVAGTWMLPRAETPVRVPAPVSPSDDTPLALVDTDDVEIISMDGDDESTLVVGEPPVRGIIILAGNGEIAMVPIDPEQQGMAGVKMKEGPTVPMLVVPINAAVPGRDE
jgi:hypothetical protein